VTPRSPRPALIALVAVVSSVALARTASAQGGPPPARVVVDAARMETLVNRRPVTGNVMSTRRSLVASQVEGLVVEFDLNAGDHVAFGAVIARLDDELATLDVERAGALLDAADGLIAEREARLAFAERELERVESLSTRNSASQSELDEARTAVATVTAELSRARADRAAAEADLARAERHLRDKTITAPFAASIISKQTELGEWLSEGDPIVELISLDDLEIRIDVPERLLPYLVQFGSSIDLRVPALGPNAMVPARFIGLIPLGNDVSRIFTARLAPDLNSATGLASVVEDQQITAPLRPGMSLTALVPTGDRVELLTVHKDAVLRDDAGPFVYAGFPGGPNGALQAVPVRIETLFATADRLAVRAPMLTPDTLVLVEGNERVFPSQPLIIINEQPDAGTTEAAAPTPDGAG
jgi:membrane fusion protein (multidrug efflux system)